MTVFSQTPPVESGISQSLAICSPSGENVGELARRTFREHLME